ncbi:MAG: hypothetical protein A3J76_02465 [Candidatus Moranbacteria bacterium RBG_13_45_13]|nr:MAG: hypothetical protein A3J76_02465 [Candidatus Moranbacteria bacterium RBG_13_45_13]
MQNANIKMKNDSVKFKNFNIETSLIFLALLLLPFYFIKLKYGWLSLNLVEILIIALFFVWFFVRDTKYKVQNTRYQIPVIFIITGLLLSIFINKNYYVGFGILKGWFILPILFAIVYYDNLKKNRKLLSWSLTAIFFSGLLVAIEGIYYWMSGFLTYDGRLRIFYDSPNQLAMFLGPVLLVGLLFTQHATPASPKLQRGERNTQHKIIWKLLLIAGLLIISFNLYLTKSYGAWLAIGLTLIAIFWLKYKKIRSPKYLFIVIIILIIFVSAVGKLENIKTLDDRSSLASRVMIWKSAGLMIKDNPLFGIGPGNFQNKYLEYQKYFPPYLEWAVPQPHNLFLAFWLESGLLGLIGFILLLIRFFRDNKKTIGNDRLLGTLCLSAMLYFLIHGLVDTTYWRNDMAILFWVVVAANLYLAGLSGPLRLGEN